MALPPSTANWHWRSKDVTSWAKTWLESQLVGETIFEEGKSSAKIDSIKSIEGDAEVGMRKSKLLTIYDINMECAWSATCEDGSTAEGVVKLPEVSHDVGADGDGDYEYTTELTSTGDKSSQAVYMLVRKHLALFLKSRLEPFPAAMLEAHGKDLKVNESSGASTPITGSTTKISSAEATEKLKGLGTSKALNTSTVTVEATLAASATEIFDLLTNESRISMWSRAAANSKPEPDGEYSIFGGNIYGKYISLDKPLKIKQTWIMRSPNWPDEHSAVMTTSLNQGSDSTAVTFELSGVPKGQEEELKNNLNGYYVRGFQSIGLGTVL